MKSQRDAKKKDPQQNGQTSALTTADYAIQAINILFDILCSIYHLFNNEVVDDDDDKFALMSTRKYKTIR